MTLLQSRIPAARSRPGGPGPTAVVIGCGFGGLAAAIRLQAKGYRTTIL